MTVILNPAIAGCGGSAAGAGAIGIDAGGRSRVSQLTTLFDGKTVRGEDSTHWDTKGTGTASFSNGANVLSVTAGQYLVRQSRTYQPYFSGKSQQVEITFDSFALEAGVIKRFGYFSSSAVAPYTATQDGWYIESNGDDGTYYLVVINDGTTKLRLPWTQWSGYDAIKGYDWDAFTVCLGDFLWLGGAVLNLYLKTPTGGFCHCHTFNYAGSAAGVFMRSPYQPVRYEIRSTTGAGDFTTICSQVASEGSISEEGKSKVLYHTTLLNANLVGTIYAVKGVRKLAAFRDVPISIQKFGGAVVTPTSDVGVWMMLRNPTLSAPLTYATNGMVDEATGAGQIVTNVGRVIEDQHSNTAGVSRPLIENSLRWLSSQIDNTMDEFVLGYMPLTVTQEVNGSIHLLEY